ncbi:c-type cytochrome [Rhodoferax sp.]|uniref:c-type cytochrome n=1 Tax=Rhodoferax sp. TaxID=50421 RepID=UPI0027222D99|nr:c-type cytochrome [Rhodoferax sp.]MDO9145131.1 c-type cytochrome [Rhodoferax sp.]MDP1528811.1 c-type cytochrome [Rhodoferax sp.]MDP1943704.1 c-type cytochrome [Rhodoferax sp.]MDP2440859.1 c-type cytochrome [Rhodoferax sp.]MDP3192596.1 c-type cytochrome [Rhodoferax sp.]
MKKFLLTASALVLSCAGTLSANAQDIKGDATAGAQKNALCVGCHGIQGYHIGFPEVHKVPKISGQGAGYIRAALNAYKSGERKHPSMRTLAASLNDQDIADLAAYYESSGSGVNVPATAAEGSVKAAELMAKGGCTSCHGANLSKPIDPSYPKIAGQHADYLYVALRSYKINEKPMIGRSHPVMAGIAKQFSDKEMKVLADYVAGLPSEIQTLQRSRVK